MRGPGPGCVGPRTVLVDKVRNIGRLVGGIPKTLLQPRLRALFAVIVSELGDLTGEGSQLTSIGHAATPAVTDVYTNLSLVRASEPRDTVGPYLQRQWLVELNGYRVGHRSFRASPCGGSEEPQEHAQFRGI